MAEDSKIEWTDHTFNPWTGCTKVSPACDNCYAEAWAKRSGLVEWGNHPRRRTSPDYWRQPIKWNKRAAASARKRVFCASLADVFDNQVPEEWRADLWKLIDECRHLDWLLLTKRPQNIAKMLPDGWGDGWPNVWLGTTVENQEEADRRIPQLLATPAAVRFLSCEPLLSAVDLLNVPYPSPPEDAGRRGSALHEHEVAGMTGNCVDWVPRLDLVIAGGESGPNARPMHPDWARGLRDQCTAAGVPFFFKQWGEWGLLPRSWRAAPHVLANDGTLYEASDLAYPGGARRGEAIRANHDRAHLHTVYRVGKKFAGRMLDEREWNEMPGECG